MPTYPLPTLACTVSNTGISAPSYADILESLKASYRSIFGSDIYIEADSQDGQWIAISAAAINDTNAAAIAAYNAFSPSTAQGAGLSSVVKINGLSRRVPTNSTADLTIGGQAGTVINNGQVGDDAGKKWNLPAVVNIPLAGTIVVTATCTEAGAISAAAGAIDHILTPTLGWQTATNVAAATPGEPVETDAQLRQRQAASTALPSITPLKGLGGVLANLSGVTQLIIYENDTDAPDANGLPEHSIAVVIEGGDAAAIASTIYAKKTEGAYTFGSTSETVTDPFGLPKTIRFSRPTQVAIQVEVSITLLSSDYTSAIGNSLRQAVADHLNALLIGADVIYSRLFLPAQLYGGAGSATYEVSLIRVKKTGGAFASADVAIAFNEVATAILADMTLIVL